MITLRAARAARRRFAGEPNMLNKLRIGPKLLLAPGLVLVLLMLVAGGAYYGMVRQNASLENLVQVRAARLRAAADIAGEAKYAHANVYQLLAWISGSFGKARLEALTATINKRHAAIGAGLAALAKVSDPAERALVDAATATLPAYRKGVFEALDLAQVDQSIATNAMQKAEKQFDILNAQLASLSALEKSLSEQAYASAREEFRWLELFMSALVLLSVALSVAITMLVRRAMLADIHAISQVVAALADGRLTTGAANCGRDEIAATSRALDHTVANLTATLRTVLDAVRSIDTASQEIAIGNQDLSNRTERQAGSLEETASAVEALTRAVRENASNAHLANELAASAAALAAKGGAAVGRAVTSMEQIRASSRKIVEIIGVIDSISFQTNILALNAAVEAARAGEQGRGFAVVAAEVRTLAQRSAAAAKEIKSLIAASVASIDGGSASVNEAGASMGDIVASVQQVNAVIERISVASSEQAAGITEVNHAVGQMDSMTQQNAALVEQAAAAAESLHEQTVNLSRAVAVFKIDDADGAGDAQQAALEADTGDAQYADAGAAQLHADPDAGFHAPREPRAAPCARPTRRRWPRRALAKRPADEARAGQAEAPRHVHGLGDADARARDHLEGLLGRCQGERRRVQRHAVHGAAHAQRLAQFAGAGTQQLDVVHPAPRAHGGDAGQRLERADQHTGAVAGLAADEVQAPVNPVGAVHVGVGRRAEHGGVALGLAAVGVRGRIVAVIGLGLDDAPADAVHQHHHADQLARHQVRRRIEIDTCQDGFHGKNSITTGENQAAARQPCAIVTKK